MSDPHRLAGRRILITGEDSLLARRLGEHFSRFGALLDVDPAPLDAGPPASPEEGSRMVHEAVESLGGLDVLINTGPAALPAELVPSSPRGLSLEGMEHALERSMSLLVSTTESAVREMGPGSSIVTTVLFASPPYLLTPEQEALTEAVLDTTRGWADILSSRGIRVNAVAGGPEWAAESLAGDDDVQEAELDPFVYLASRESRCVTGSVLGVARAYEHALEGIGGFRNR
ncbi:SDR family oxidoreductase [Sinomonas halotolerans]|uniref:SDR family oxidoreductase n=1 Tax=Sinomonas halotolerans TaxID=1644133 RepID=A0ABU9X0A1_9MICC